MQAKKKKRKSILEMPEEQEIRLDADIQNGQLSKKAKHKESAQNVEEDIEVPSSLSNEPWSIMQFDRGR